MDHTQCLYALPWTQLDSCITLLCLSVGGWTDTDAHGFKKTYRVGFDVQKDCRRAIKEKRKCNKNC